MDYLCDDKDKKIIDLLKEHSDYTTRQIAKKTLLPVTTIHNRIKKLKKEGIIKKFSIELNNNKLGKNFSALILISVNYRLLREFNKDQHQLAKEIKLLPDVEKVYVVTGGTDLVVRVRVKNVEEYDAFLMKKLQKINGVNRTQSLVIIHEK